MEKEQLKGTQAKIQAFEARKEALMKMGGDKMITKQHELGKLTAGNGWIACTTRIRFRKYSFL